MTSRERIRPRPRGLFAATVLAMALLAAFAPFAAQADGEAGLVIQNGDQVETYCVPFAGDGISGEQLLTETGHDVVQFGGGARTLCAIDDVGCFNPSSFDGCFCQCTGGDCVYWAFFTKKYGSSGFVYSTAAFNNTKAADGDVHGWKWGVGNRSSAPAPQDISFEQICGHEPNGTANFTPGTGNATATVTINRDSGGGGGSNTGPLIAFGAVAVVLAGAIGAAAWWRRSHGR